VSYCRASLIPLLVFTLRAFSAPITFESAPLLVTAGDPDNRRYSAPPGAGYDGIGRLFVDRLDGGVACTASLLGSGRQLLTAAHCVTDSEGLVNAMVGEVTFVTSAGEETIPVSDYSVHPDWTGNVKAGADIAVLTLSRAASLRIDRYGLYGGSDEVGAAFDLVGFGLTGTGSSGAIQDDMIRRRGRNRVDGTVAGTLDRFPGWRAGSNVLLSDFDDGSSRHDALGVFFDLVDSGLGMDEVNPAPGDSGGPGLIGGRIAGVSSFATRLSRSDGSTPDVDSFLNGSTGEVSGFTRISTYSSWIEDQLQPVPEPRTLSFVAVCVAAGFVRRFRGSGRNQARSR
jgi:hypothetical protein